MDFAWVSDPTALLGLGTLILLELVLGIDNLIFIAILADKLPPEQRARARTIGLSLALIMRLGLLVTISWIAGLTEPIFTIIGLAISGRDLILIGGGLFLLTKATMELHERLEGGHGKTGSTTNYAVFWQVIAQIIVLDAVFSLDSVITAVGMVQELTVMMIAMIVAVLVMLAAARPLMEFVTRHPTVVVLCLGFLLMIGFTLIAEGFDVKIPKGYLYAAIGFSVLIEFFNQLARRNRLRVMAAGALRNRTAEAVLRLLGGGGRGATAEPAEGTSAQHGPEAASVFAPEERSMVRGVMALGERNVRSIMTPRTEVTWLDLDAPQDEARHLVVGSGRSRFPVARGRLDELAGVALTRDLLQDLLRGGAIDVARSVHPPVIVPENLPVLVAMERLRQSPVQMLIVVDEYGSVEGVVTPTDILEAIAGEFPEGADEPIRIEAQSDGSWLVDAQIDIHRLGHLLEADLVDQAGRYTTLAGLMMWRLGRLPAIGDTVRQDDLSFEVTSLDRRRPGLVLVRTKAASAAER
ncbi:TerC family protein [Roseomonas terrae]|jgi:CBS domain containing-hemolysin-like protein|uniref:TerC family protein n=1 Tax=Neoroseomonas terrae TaxID=424799 RepID=A0ABS5EMF5_9PROT|nr:TerC family protein [Neoroseomonas terrae]MBR0652201.1 TerC family protein [Neoroseomonas terrae]